MNENRARYVSVREKSGFQGVFKDEIGSLSSNQCFSESEVDYAGNFSSLNTTFKKSKNDVSY